MSALDALPRLLQLASPALPVGAYTYSQGLEWAVESGQVRDEASAGRWIGDLLAFGLARFEAPLVARLMRAWAVGDAAAAQAANQTWLASRESAELHAETLQMGTSLLRLLESLELPAGDLAPLKALPQPGYPAAWAFCAVLWRIDTAPALTAYLWAWLENQVLAAVKCVPLGQSAGQRLLLRLSAAVPEIARQAPDLPQAQWSNFAPGLALACCRHETQYSRLFRS